MRDKAESWLGINSEDKTQVYEEGGQWIYGPQRALTSYVKYFYNSSIGRA